MGWMRNTTVAIVLLIIALGVIFVVGKKFIVEEKVPVLLKCEKTGEVKTMDLPASQVYPLKVGDKSYLPASKLKIRKGDKIEERVVITGREADEKIDPKDIIYEK